MTGPAAAARGRRWRRPVAALVGLCLGLSLVEGCLRLFAGEPGPLGRLYFRDASGAPVGTPGREDLLFQEAVRRGLIEQLPPAQTPRPRLRFAPGAEFFMCYEDAVRLGCDWLDARGCVPVHINRFGLRERDEIAPDNKAAGERRVLCIGDSFTFGWGVPVEQCWVRRLEDALRAEGRDVRTVNCGASGALVVDEYWWGLRTRFGAFQPDVVLVAICLNDLLPSSGLYVQGPISKPTGILLFDRARAALQRSPLDLDPSLDWVGALLALPRAAGEEARYYGHDKPYDAMWAQGAPQAALLAMRDWCRERQVQLGVLLWPFLQGLGPTSHYPLRRIHELVATYCGEIGVPFLDLLRVLEREPAAKLWVTPADMHPNPRAHALVGPTVADFCRALLPR